MLDKYRLHIALGLIVTVVAASALLFWQNKDSTDRLKKEKISWEVKANNLEKENLDLKDKIIQLEQSTQSTIVDQTNSIINSEIGQVKSASSASNQSVLSVSSRVNINTADARELDSLPGIGPTRAQTIIDYRNNNGPFQSSEDIMKVSGIGQATYDKMKEKITVE